MSSTVLTVRSAVLNGVFSGTRSMPNWMSVIFMGRPSWNPCPVFFLVPASSAADAHDAGHAVYIGLLVVVEQRQQRGHQHRVELDAHAAAVGLAVTHAAHVVDHPGLALVLADHHHHVAGDVDQVADL